MNWEAIGALAELCGAAALVATLVYLAVQIRQNNKLLNVAQIGDGSVIQNQQYPLHFLNLLQARDQNLHFFNIVRVAKHKRADTLVLLR